MFTCVKSPKLRESDMLEVYTDLVREFQQARYGMALVQRDLILNLDAIHQECDALDAAAIIKCQVQSGGVHAKYSGRTTKEDKKERRAELSAKADELRSVTRQIEQTRRHFDYLARRKAQQEITDQFDELFAVLKEFEAKVMMGVSQGKLNERDEAIERRLTHFFTLLSRNLSVHAVQNPFVKKAFGTPSRAKIDPIIQCTGDRSDILMEFVKAKINNLLKGRSLFEQPCMLVCSRSTELKIGRHERRWLRNIHAPNSLNRTINYVLEEAPRISIAA